jgi:membrane protease YdiL (CAAX protease family)
MDSDLNGHEEQSSTAPSLWAAGSALLVYFMIQLAVGLMMALGLLLFAVLSGKDHPTALLGTSSFKSHVFLLAVPLSCGLSILLYRYWFNRAWKGVGFTGLGIQPLAPGRVGLHVLLGMGVSIMGGALAAMLSHGKSVPEDIVQILLHSSFAVRVGIALAAVLIVPVAEEILFRGILLSALLRHASLSVAVGLDATLFALVHLPDLGWKPQGLLPLALVGGVCCWRRIRTGSIYSAIAVHAGFNLLAVLVFFLH